MSVIPLERIQELQKLLDSELPGVWRKIIHTLAITGLADNQQLIQACGLQRDKLRRSMDKIIAITAGFPPVFSHYPRQLKRGNQPGAGPRIYRLGESGAALCRLDGLVHAAPCLLEEHRAVYHAMGMLDVHLAARAAGLEVITDRNLKYSDLDNIRPDNLVALADGRRAIYETEQDARSGFLDRIINSLTNKVSFFDSRAGESVSSIVRMLIDLPTGAAYTRTLKTWYQAIEIIRENHGDPPFRLLAMPLGQFLANPDWSPEAETGVWIDLTAPEISASFTEITTPLAQLAQELPEYTNPERRLIVAALMQNLRETNLFAQRPQPDNQFLYLMQDIYLASHAAGISPLGRCGIPQESIFLLHEYLLMCPGLLQKIDHVIQTDARRIHWNQSTALHRMQVATDMFLEYHGWSSAGPLTVYAYTPDYEARQPRHFSVRVEIRDPEILMESGPAVVPSKREIEGLETALSWVLTALFAFTHHLGMRKPPFW